MSPDVRIWQVAAGTSGRYCDDLFKNHDAMFLGPGDYGHFLTPRAAYEQAKADGEAGRRLGGISWHAADDRCAMHLGVRSKGDRRWFARRPQPGDRLYEVTQARIVRANSPDRGNAILFVPAERRGLGPSPDGYVNLAKIRTANVAPLGSNGVDAIMALTPANLGS